MTVVWVAGLSMFLGDVGQGVYVILMARTARGGPAARFVRRMGAGFFDGLDDDSQLFSVGLGGATVLRIGAHGSLHVHVTVITLWLVAAITLGSMLGAAVGDLLTARVTRNTPTITTEGARP